MSNSVEVLDLTVDPKSLSTSEISGIRWAFAISGILAVVIGGLVLAWPEATLNVLATLFGLYFLAAGVVHIVRGIFTAGAGVGGRVLSILLGVLLVVAGIVAIRNPLNSLVLLAMVIGISWIIEGVVGLVETAHDSSRWFGWLRHHRHRRRHGCAADAGRVDQCPGPDRRDLPRRLGHPPADPGVHLRQAGPDGAVLVS